MGKSRIYVVGIGPGSYDKMTIQAEKVLKSCDLIIGYTLYVDLIREHFPGKEFLSTPMTQEVRRCELAFEEAGKGKSVAMVCSGDAGVYGMAGLMLEIGKKHLGCEVEVIAGVTAALGGAAILGAPLAHDFAVISLSDLLTSWETIARRLEAAAKADFVICLYNPSSRKRHDYLKKACEIVLKNAAPDRVCGLAKRIGREGETWEILSLEKLQEKEVDMFTTVFIGNSQTVAIDGKMVTPRGYLN